MNFMKKKSFYCVPFGVSSGVPILSYESSDDKYLTEEALIQAFKLLYTKWTESTKMNEKLSSNIVQSHMEKKNLEMAIVDLWKTNVDLESRLKQSHNEEA